MSFPIPNRKLLLISSPRSGSTLLANLIRSSNRVIFLNEIFTRAPFLLPDFEADFEAGRSFTDSLKKNLLAIWKYKLPYAGLTVHRARTIKFLCACVAKTLAALNSRLGEPLGEWNAFYKYYYLNGLHEPLFAPLYRTTFRKKKPDTLLIKDVRMPKALPAALETFDDCRIIYLVRNPLFVVDSTLRQRELTDASPLLLDREYLKSTFHRPDLVDRFLDGPVEQKLALVWRLENEDAIHRLKEIPSDRKITIQYEAMVRNLPAVAERIFEWCHLPMDGQTREYVRAANTFTGKRAHDRSTFVDMKKKQLNGIPAGLGPEQAARISQVLGNVHERVPGSDSTLARKA